MAELTLADLVANRTLSAAGAATLTEAVRARQSILVAAIPRMAGKTTVLRAALATGDAPVHQLSADQPGLGIPERTDGYLLVSEVAQTPFPDYLWGEDVRRAFSAVQQGFSLAASLHADGVESAFRIITAQNGVPDAEAAAIKLFVYIRSLGHWETPTRRVVASIERVEGVSDGRPSTRVLHRWDEAGDRFEEVAS